MGRFFIGFLLIQGILFTAELLRPVQQAVVIPWTEAVARASAWLAQRFDSAVLSQGKVLHHQTNDFAVSIEAGCNGIEASIILVAAMLAFPAPWRYRLIGLGCGFLAIHTLNLLRIISLFYLGQWNVTAFEWAHLYLWQALIMLDALVVFLVWLRTLPAPNRKPI